MTNFYDFPHSNNPSTEHTQALLGLIKMEIDRAGGPISFAHFMDLSLYHPQYGFYCTQAYDQHFKTAPLISSLFAKCLSNQMVEILTTIEQAAVLEIGAGNGQLACDLILAFKKAGVILRQYIIFEKSTLLRQKQQQKLTQCCPEFMNSVQWVDELPVQFQGVIVANEVLDALPVHCFQIDGSHISERGVTFKNNTLEWKKRNCSSTLLFEKIHEINEQYSLPNGYQSELNLALILFIERISQSLTKGVIFFIDYGYGRAEYYHPERKHGTLTCFYHHKKHENPFIFPGLQDITAHVDFTRVAEISAEAGLDVLGYTSQSAFLLSCGLLSLAAEQEEQLSVKEQIKLHTEIKLLTLPSEMGECIKIMALGRDFSQQLQGFNCQDRRRDL